MMMRLSEGVKGGGLTVCKNPEAISIGCDEILDAHASSLSAAVLDSDTALALHIAGSQPGGETYQKWVQRPTPRNSFQVWSTSGLVLLGTQCVALHTHSNIPAASGIPFRYPVRTFEYSTCRAFSYMMSPIQYCRHLGTSMASGYVNFKCSKLG